MRVKKLEIFGFKSFATRQSIIFGEGVTGIVGPNGCGKSNVVDALRWVMGEQNPRHLRGGNMQDIIFCGSEKKAALGFAEVILTIENNQQDAPLEYNHFTEIQISRRLYKTGESEYEINKQKARLKDISDFFLGTGVGTKAYSIIEQGRVNDIVSAKPLDRRVIIEEAAGITKYKAKKASAERRMEATRINLNRIVDIKNEVDKRVQVLHKEKEKLEKVQGLKDQIRHIDLHIASHRYLAVNAELRYFLSSKKKLETEINDNRQSLAAKEVEFAKILETYASKHDKKRLLDELLTQHQQSLELFKKDLEYTTTTLNENQLLVTRLSSQIDDIESRSRELADDNEKFRAELDIKTSESKNLAAELSSRKNAGQSVIERRQKNISDERDVQKKIVDAATTAARLQAEITSLREQETQKQTDLKNIEVELNIKNDELSQLTARIDVISSEVSHGADRRSSLQTELNELDGNLRRTRDAFFVEKRELSKLSDEQITFKARLKSLLEIDTSLEWSESGVAELLTSEKKHLLKGVIADVITVTPGAEETVEQCLAHVLDAALVADYQDLIAVADFLKKKGSLKTSFLLLDNRQKVVEPFGLSSLADFLSIKDQKHARVLDYFSRFFVADDLMHAIDHWPAAREKNVTIVAKDGEVFFPDGRAIFGQKSDKGILKRKTEIISLENKIKDHELAIDAITKKVQASEKLVKSLEAKKEQQVEELRTLNFGIVRLEDSLKQKNHELQKFKTEHEKLLLKRDTLNKNVSSVDEKIAQLHLQWSTALDNHKNFEETLLLIRADRGSVEADYESFHQALKIIEVQKASVDEKIASLTQSLEQSQKNLLHLASQKASFLEQMNDKAEDELKLKENLRQTEKKIAQLEKELEETAKMQSALRVECEELTVVKLSKEQELGALQQQSRSLVDKLHRDELLINNAMNDINNICERIKDRHRISLVEKIVDFHDQNLDENAAKKEAESLQKTLDRLGSVNENASNEYDEFFARAQFLDAQVNDLNDALTQLETAIKKINKTTKMRFMEAFTSINKQFSQVFPRLFNGGHAELVLGDQEDLLNCGVEIIAKPPGKNIGSIDLMSGGEKALTAISLIMAIFLIKPSPFCLLDEVDAPLDEANVSRFSQLVKEMSELSQFIVITHNRKTMESADQLYGVTMEDAGMSKIVSVHVQQAFEALKQNSPVRQARGARGEKRQGQLFLE